MSRNPGSLNLLEPPGLYMDRFTLYKPAPLAVRLIKPYINKNPTRFEVLTAVLMKIQVFWDVMP
jgi:hypothetical protein